ncbi:hypothetical protein VCRA2120E57_130061 [Vibrio crassostreae]|nr:hypothetical protein VCRA2120E57_130061 [Vibrio crassostreae]
MWMCQNGARIFSTQLGRRFNIGATVLRLQQITGGLIRLKTIGTGRMKVYVTNLTNQFS